MNATIITKEQFRDDYLCMTAKELAKKYKCTTANITYHARRLKITKKGNGGSGSRLRVI